MATKKFITLQGYSDEELTNEINVTEEELKKAKFDHAIHGLDNPLKLKDVKKDIARLYTEQRRRELAGMTPEQLAKRSKIRRRRK
ncbi:MAG: 50S ribosomal protein L29 [Saprospiraceae bacterium]|nr:50S ribosomal protein L29 [Saprospiraceae bacterium]